MEQKNTSIIITIIIAVSIFSAAYLFTLVTHNASQPVAQDEVKTKLTFSTIENKLKNNKAILYDVRTPEEYAEGYIQGAKNFPLQKIKEGILPSGEKDGSIYVYCRSGNRSAEAKKLLADAGYSNVTDLGGINDVKDIGGVIATVETDKSRTLDKIIHILEAEKMTHDAYGVFYNTYQSTSFKNAYDQKTTNQELLAKILTEHDIKDPRKNITGSFDEKELQTSYDTLIELGIKSEKEAYIAIRKVEEQNKKYIQSVIETTKDTPGIQTLNQVHKNIAEQISVIDKQLSVEQSDE